MILKVLSRRAVYGPGEDPSPPGDPGRTLSASGPSIILDCLARRAELPSALSNRVERSLLISLTVFLYASDCSPLYDFERVSGLSKGGPMPSGFCPEVES